MSQIPVAAALLCFVAAVYFFRRYRDRVVDIRAWLIWDGDVARRAAADSRFRDDLLDRFARVLERMEFDETPPRRLPEVVIRSAKGHIFLSWLIALTASGMVLYAALGIEKARWGMVAVLNGFFFLLCLYVVKRYWLPLRLEKLLACREARARLFDLAGRREAAEEELRLAWDKVPGDPGLTARLVDALTGLERTEECLDVLARSREARGGDLELALREAGMALRHGLTARAAALAEALAEGPDARFDPRPTLLAAVAAHRAGEIGKAASLFGDALKIDSDAADEFMALNSGFAGDWAALRAV